MHILHRTNVLVAKSPHDVTSHIEGHVVTRADLKEILKYDSSNLTLLLSIFIILNLTIAKFFLCLVGKKLLLMPSL